MNKAIFLSLAGLFTIAMSPLAKADYIPGDAIITVNDSVNGSHRGNISGLQEDIGNLRYYSSTQNDPGIYFNLGGGAAQVPFEANLVTANALCKTLVGPDSKGAITATAIFQNKPAPSNTLLVSFEGNQFVFVPGAGQSYMTEWTCTK